MATERYEAQRGYTWSVFVHGQHRRIRSDNRDTEMTEAEAKIIAFALNAVAEGYTLAYGRKQITTSSLAYITKYDGPTEGVAP